MADPNIIKPFGRGIPGRGKRLLDEAAPTASPALRQPRDRPVGSSIQSSESSRTPSSGVSPPYLSPAGGAIRKIPSSLGRSQLTSGTSGYDSAVSTPVFRSTPSPPESSSSGSAPKPSFGRGYQMAQFIKAEKSSSTTSSGHSDLGKGRGAALRDIILKGKSSSSGETHSGSSLADEFEKLRIPKEVEEEVRGYHGSQGTRITASSNWVRIALDPKKQVFEYAVTFKPSIDDQRMRYRLLSMSYLEIGNVKSFDGASKLWLPKRLKQMVTQLRCQHPLTSDDVEIVLTLKLETSMWKCIQLYNVLFNRIMRILKMTLMGKGYFSHELASIIKHQQLEIWPGYVTAAHQMEGGVMLNVDISHRVLRDKTVYSTLNDIYKSQAQRRETFKQTAIGKLVGSIVMTRYNKKTYRIDDIAFDKTPRDTFETHDGEQIAYCDYYKNTYNKVIEDLQQPLLMHKLKKKELKDKDKSMFIYLVPELCHLTGLTDEMRGDFRLMKDIAQHTRLTPNARQASLRKFLTNVKDNPEAQKVLGDWGLSLLTETIELEGRIVPKEAIEFGQKMLKDVQNADWGRESCNSAVISPVDLKGCCWMIVVPKRIERCARSFFNMYQSVVRGMGIGVGPPDFVTIPDDRIESYIKGIKAHHTPGKTQLAVVVFPTQREDRYSAIKKLTISELGLSSQCMNARTISQESKLRSVTAKIALQINCKLGGELWALRIPVDGIMVCGIDVYHDPVRKGASVVGFVASLNPRVTRWYTHVSFQNPGEEIVNGMKISFMECLKAYYKENHTIPKIVVIYRDGVSEGLLKLTGEHEIPQIATVLMNFSGEQQTKLYYIIVLKRISTRIFVSINASSYDNPPPGTIVDHTITKRYWSDFFLVSQHVRQGTVSPTHYIVLKDSGNFSPDNIQRLTYKMTHLYYNWPGTIRVPAPCQYAHKVAYLIGQNVRRDPRPELMDKLYFL